MGWGALQLPDDFALNLSGARVPGTDLSNTRLTNADLRHADFTGANFRGANMDGARLEGTILIGADLTGVRNLTWEQLDQAVIDDSTILPDYLDRDRKRPR